MITVIRQLFSIRVTPMGLVATLPRTMTLSDELRVQIDEQRAFVQRVIDRTGLNQTQLANRAGFDPSTLSSFMSQRREGQTLSSRVIRKIEVASGIIMGPMPRFPAVAETPDHGFAEAEALPYIAARQPDGDAVAAAVKAICEGRNATDPWVLKTRALEAIGHQPGDVMIVDLNMAPEPGDVVCATVIDWRSRGAEALFRIFQPPVLLAAPTSPGLLKPYMIDQNLMIRGTVIASVKPRRKAS